MNFIKIGVIVNTHGLNGTLKVKSFTDFKEERYKKNTPLFIEYKGEFVGVTVGSYKTVKGIEHIQFLEFNNINECEKYKGSNLYISADLVHDLEEDEFYFQELMGMTVYSDILLGVVVDVREVPQGELLEVETSTKKHILIPFNKEFIKSVDKNEKVIQLLFWEGLY